MEVAIIQSYINPSEDIMAYSYLPWAFRDLIARCSIYIRKKKKSKKKALVKIDFFKDLKKCYHLTNV